VSYHRWAFQSLFWLSLCKIVRSSVILLLPLFIASLFICSIVKEDVIYLNIGHFIYFCPSSIYIFWIPFNIFKLFTIKPLPVIDACSIHFVQTNFRRNFKNKRFIYLLEKEENIRKCTMVKSKTKDIQWSTKTLHRKDWETLTQVLRKGRQFLLYYYSWQK
jgi:hypothetical protein